MSDKIGYTGTRRGMTDAQKERLFEVLSAFSGEMHHGDAIGGDAQAHDIAQDAGLLPVLHPATGRGQRAFCKAPSYLIRKPKPPLDRNRDIVDETSQLVAAPFEAEPQQRGGTWYTVRYAYKLGRRIRIIRPDGSVASYAPE